MADQLIPRAPKRKLQPTSARLREQLVLAVNEIIRLRTPWWRRWFVARWKWDPDALPPPGPPFRCPSEPQKVDTVRIQQQEHP